MTKKSAIKHGDLVMVAGYIDRLFFVDGWQDVTYYEPDAIYSETLYYLTCAHTGESDLAYAEDVVKVCDAAQADDYLMYDEGPVPTKLPPPDLIAWGIEWNAENKPKGERKIYRKPERKPTQRELSNQEAERRKQARKERQKKIDALLDEYNDTNALLEMFGDEEYKAKAEYLRLKLAELSEEGKRYYE